MADQIFVSIATVALTSSTSSQTVTLPAGGTSMIAFNGGSNPVYLRWGSSISIPTTPGSGCYFVAPGQTALFSCQQSGGTLAYIADTAGGQLAISVGTGY